MADRHAPAPSGANSEGRAIATALRIPGSRHRAARIAELSDLPELHGADQVLRLLGRLGVEFLVEQVPELAVGLQRPGNVADDGAGPDHRLAADLMGRFEVEQRPPDASEGERVPRAFEEGLEPVDEAVLQPLAAAPSAKT